jgi:hypothetical protein
MKMPEHKKVLQTQKAGTTKIFACDSVDTGFDYLIFSESKPLIRSIHAAILSGTGFRATFQPTLSTPVHGTGKHVVGIICVTSSGKSNNNNNNNKSKQEQQQEQEPFEPPMTCETLRQVLDSRSEVKCIEHDRLLNLMKTMYAQMYDLETTHRRMTPYISLDDVVIVNDSIAVFINDDKLFQINGTGEEKEKEKEKEKEETMDITRAIGREAGAFYPPELSGDKIASLPYTVNVRCAYYSFGMMVAYCATLNPKLVMKSTAIRKLNLKKEGVLSSIEGTKLYWFILRCCASKPMNRTMLYV